MRFARLLLLATLAAVLHALPAHAAFSGSNGQLVYIDDAGGLTVEDPYAPDGPTTRVIAQATKLDQENGLAPPSAPQWSPDGTRILYTEPVANGNIPKEHSAVFVINADGTGRQQVSTPFPGRLASCGVCKDGESAWDVSPVWKNADTVAFIRWVAADDDAEHEAQEGTSVRTVPVGGGGESLVKHFPNENQEAVMGIVWPATWSEPLMAYANGSGMRLEAVSSGTVYATPLGITDFDVSANGQQIAYGTIGPSGRRVITLGLDGKQIDAFDPGFHPEWVRFAPDGSHLIVPGCARGGDDVDHCGLVTHRLPDPEADVKPGEATERPYLDRSVVDIQFPYLPGSRPSFDIQSQDLPLIYVPGFLGSEILCDQVPVWMPAAPPLVFQKMQLQSDGTSAQTCATARPSGKMVESFLGADVYGHADDWLEAMNPPGGYASFGWDWRKAPQESLGKLDQLVTDLTENPLLVKQGVSRVSMVGHSYGALLMRAYIDDEARAKRVARVLTVGAPYWGSPKPVFGLAFGIELPSFSAIDAMAMNDDMRDFVRNAPGAYHLFPSDNYGGWLRLNGGQPLDQSGVRGWLTTQASGNGALLDQARATHQEHIDGFYDRQGRIDYRSVTGVGLLTIGGMNIMQPGRDGESLSVGVFYEDGDGTVTARSATQGPQGTADPLGDDVHIQYRCGIEHMRQTADKVVQGAYARFLVDGHLPRRLPAPSCKPEGQTIKVFHGLEVEPAAGPAERALAGDALTLGEAEFAGKAQVIDLPEETLITTNDAVPVELRFTVEDTKFSVTPLSGDQQGEEQVYGPVTGEVRIDEQGTDVTVDGQPVSPVPPVASPTPTPTATATATATASPTATATATPAPSATPAPTAGPAQPCAAKAKAKKALKKAQRAYRQRATKKNKRRVVKAKKALRRAKQRCT